MWESPSGRDNVRVNDLSSPAWTVGCWNVTFSRPRNTSRSGESILPDSLKSSPNLKGAAETPAWPARSWRPFNQRRKLTKRTAIGSNRSLPLSTEIHPEVPFISERHPAGLAGPAQSGSTVIVTGVTNETRRKVCCRLPECSDESGCSAKKVDTRSEARRHR